MYFNKPFYFSEELLILAENRNNDKACPYTKISSIP